MYVSDLEKTYGVGGWDEEWWWYIVIDITRVSLLLGYCLCPSVPL